MKQDCEQRKREERNRPKPAGQEYNRQEAGGGRKEARGKRNKGRWAAEQRGKGRSHKTPRDLEFHRPPRGPRVLRAPESKQAQELSPMAQRPRSPMVLRT